MVTSPKENAPAPALVQRLPRAHCPAIALVCPCADVYTRVVGFGVGFASEMRACSLSPFLFVKVVVSRVWLT